MTDLHLRSSRFTSKSANVLGVLKDTDSSADRSQGQPNWGVFLVRKPGIRRRRD
jgi:hypothetical protein